MAFSITQLADEPIVIITVDLPLDRHMESLRSTQTQLNHLAASADSTLYFVFDVSKQEVAFSDILIGLDELESDPSSWINFPNVRLVVVGTHPMLAIMKKRFYQHLNVLAVIYASLNEALAQIRSEVGDASET